MKAVIIAAGEGSRLGHLTKDKPKPMVKLLGLSLIERVILNAKETGITEFVVVTGCLEDKLKSFLGDGTKYGVQIEYVYNDQWKQPNGISVLAARKSIKEKFVLLMGDHVFQSETLLKLKEMPLAENECLLAVDRKMKNILDLTDATKVKTDNDKIVAIGKDLIDFDAIDTGMFLCSPSFFEVLEKSINQGYCSLTDSVRTLSKEGLMKVFDIQDNFWSDNDTVEDLEHTEKHLLKRLSKPTDGPISRYLNRPISTRISKLLAKTSLTPNMISFLSFLLGIIAAGFFGVGRYIWTVVGGLLVQFSSVVDGCDGEIARLKFQKSDYGSWFDAVLDRYADGLIILGMTYGLWSVTDQYWVWIVGFVATMGSFMNSYTAVRYDAAFKKNLFQAKRSLRIGRDIRALIIMLGALTNQILITLLVLAVIGNFESIRRLIVLKDR